MTVEKQVEAIVKALEDRKGMDIKVYDVRGKSSLADFFVVATGTAADLKPERGGLALLYGYGWCFDICPARVMDS